MLKIVFWWLIIWNYVTTDYVKFLIWEKFTYFSFSILFLFFLLLNNFFIICIYIKNILQILYIDNIYIEKKKEKNLWIILSLIRLFCQGQMKIILITFNHNINISFPLSMPRVINFIIFNKSYLDFKIRKKVLLSH